MIALLRAFLLIAGILVVAGASRADVPPSPGRPDFEDTPLPMPDEPEEIAVMAIAALGLAAFVMQRRRTAC